MASFNINDKVRVKLTEKGLRVLRDRHEELRAMYFGIGEHTPPETDEEGWSAFQLWDLMASFGSSIVMGHALPFETDIDIPSLAQQGTET